MNAIESNISAVLARFQRGLAQSRQALDAADAEANEQALEYAQEIAPYRTGALRDSLHRVAGDDSATRVTSSIAPGSDIFYSLYLIKLATGSADHRYLNWPERTATERPDIAAEATAKGAEVLTHLLEGTGA